LKDTLIIPTKDALLALDLVAASLQHSEDTGITLCNTDTYLRLKNVYQFHGISGIFAKRALTASKDEGKRQMMTKQPVHVRYMASSSPDFSLLRHDID